MKKFFSVILCVTCALTLLAQTPDGLTCETAIPVDKSYQGSIDAPGVYYYTAWTYDLPLTCYFYPTSEVDSLYLDIDFTCTPGVYDDPNMAELLDPVFGWGETVPIRFDDFEKNTDDVGRVYYSLSVSKMYRELMAELGISYDVEAKVKLVTSTAGDIRLTPDTAFRACVETSTWLDAPSTIPVGLMHNEDVYVLPLADWANDSVYFRWDGAFSPMQIWIGKECGFNLSTSGDNPAYVYHQLEPAQGNGENIWVLTEQMIDDFVNEMNTGGFCYLRFISMEDSQVMFNKKPVEGAMADAIRLELGNPVNIKANDTEQVYYFPADWKQRNILFESSINTSVTAYFSKDVVFEADSIDDNVLSVRDFINADLKFSVDEMTTMLDGVNNKFVFVKFVAEESITITPVNWNTCNCVRYSEEIYPNDVVEVKQRAQNEVYRINYSLWSKNDMKITWDSKSSIKIYLADTCTGFTLSSSNDHVLLYKSMKANSSFEITGAELREWEEYVDLDGYLYFRFNANAAGSLIVTATPDPTVQPEEPSSPCVANSIELKANDQLVLNLDSAFTVYRINYNEWVATGATLTWKGTEPLHTFVAETCEFAVAPYNKYVHAYVSIPTEGVAVLDAAKLAEMAAYVDEDGYLYIRFLTEKEGVLTVK